MFTHERQIKPPAKEKPWSVSIFETYEELKDGGSKSPLLVLSFEYWEHAFKFYDAVKEDCECVVGLSYRDVVIKTYIPD